MAIDIWVHLEFCLNFCIGTQSVPLNTVDNVVLPKWGLLLKENMSSEGAHSFL